ncbi:MAG: ankyrin repeat domain-containing protein [Planctomycetota bacterium]
MMQCRLFRLFVLCLLLMFWNNRSLRAAAGLLHEAAEKGDAKEIQALISKGADLNATDSDGRTPLHCAVGSENLRDSHLDVAKLLLAHGAAIDARDRVGRTPLNTATDALSEPTRKESAEYRMIEFLISEGADINAKPERGWTALHWVVGMGHKELAELLIARGAKVDSTDCNGNTPLHWAVDSYASSRRMFSIFGPEPAEEGKTLLPWRTEGSLTDLTRLLIASGADVNAKNNGGDSPLIWAAKSADLELVKLLVASGADIKVTGTGAETRGYRWTWTGDREIPTFSLSRRAGRNASAAGGTTPLHFAAMQGDKNVVEFLIAQGADVNARNQADVTPLGFAVGGYRDIKGLPPGYNPETYSERGDYFYKQTEYDRAIEDYTSALRVDRKNAGLHICRGRAWAKKGDSEKAVSDWKRAIELDRINAIDVHYESKLLQAPDAELDRLLREVATAQLDNLGTVSGSAVGFAARPGAFYTISLILSEPFEEAEFLKMTRDDNPVVRAMGLICLARHDRTRYEETIQSFYSDRTEVRYMPMGCILGGTTLGELAMRILQDPDALDPWSPSHTEGRAGMVWLHSGRKAEERKRTELVEILVSKGADVDTEGQRGETPLHYAAQHGCKRIAELLIDGGAEVDAEDEISETPLYHAIRWGYRDVAELLIAYGADVNLTTRSGLNALTIAQEMNYPGLVRLLREHGAKE